MVPEKRAERLAENEKESTRSLFRKGLVGLVSTVAAGVLVWWFTSAGGPLDPKKAEIRLNALSVYPIFNVGTAPGATASVENAGDRTATDCRILWSAFTGDPEDAAFPATTDFSMSPGERRDLPLTTSSQYRQTGSYEMAAQLVCDSERSQVIVKTVGVQ
jgi:hypothetical protein